MEYRVLQYFWTVADAGTISAAAKRLHMTQPTLSRQIRDLELELNTKLFDRRHNRLTLTQDGQFLKSRASEILTLTQQTQQAFIDRNKALYSGTIHVGGVETDSSDLLAQVLQAELADYPKVRFTLETGDSTWIADQLDKGLLDIAMMIEPVDTTKYHALQFPQIERWGLIVPQDEPLAALATITPKILPTLPLIMPQRELVSNMIKQWAGTSAPLNVIGRYNLNLNLVPMVSQHVGCAVGIEGVIRSLNQTNIRFVPFDPALSTHCVLVWRRERVLAPIVSDFIRRFENWLDTVSSN